jgi:hypothetical protein
MRLDRSGLGLGPYEGTAMNGCGMTAEPVSRVGRDRHVVLGRSSRVALPPPAREPKPFSANAQDLGNTVKGELVVAVICARGEIPGSGRRTAQSAISREASHASGRPPRQDREPTVRPFMIGEARLSFAE